MPARLAGAARGLARWDGSDRHFPGFGLYDGSLSVITVVRASTMSEMTLPAGAQDPRWDHPPRSIMPRTRLIGREADLAHLADLLQDASCRLLTITGPGGVGKTRLALTLASSPAFAERASFVSLVDVKDVALIPATILRALGLEGLPGRSVEDVVMGSLRGRHVLLVLDNLEHLPGAPAQIAGLLDGCPDLQVLTTSRIALGLGDEQQFPLAPLSLPATDAPSSDVLVAPAVQMFIDRMHLVLPDLETTPANVAVIASICRQLDGLPLAIELAAAQCRQLAPHVLAERLSQRVSLPVPGPSDLPVRHQTLQSTVLWSVNLLEPRVGRLWRALGVFEGGFTLEAAEAIAVVVDVPPAEVPAMLDRLQMHDLVRLGANAIGEPRYYLLHITRDVAFATLQTDERLAAVLDTHAEACARFCAGAEPGLMGTDGTSWFARVDSEMANIRAAFDHDLAAGHILRPLSMATHLHWFWTDPGYLQEGLSWLSTLLARVDDTVPDSLRRAALAAASSVADWLNQTDAALEFATQALDLARQTGDRVAEMEVMLHLGNVHFDDSDLVQAERWFREGHAVAQEVQAVWHMAAFANLRALVADAEGDVFGAADWHRTAMAGWRASGFQSHLSIAATGLAVVLVELGVLDEAVAALLETLPRIDRKAVSAEGTMAVAGAGLIAHSLALPLIAIRFIAASMHLRQAMGVEFRPYFVTRLSGLVDELRAEVAAPAFGRAWSEGAAYAMGDALDEIERFLVDLPTRVVLTAREREVLDLLVAGASDSDIADRLYISRRTASKHVAAILEKLDAPNRTTAVAIAYRRGLVIP